jgi:hypothetical protein
MSSWRNARIRSRGLRWARGSTVAVVLAVFGVGAMVASAGGRAGLRSARSGCYPKGSTTVAQDKAGRFFRIGSSPLSGPWYVCAFQQGTPRRLSGFKNPDASRPVGPSARVAGRYVAFFLCCVGGSAVDVVDMVTGHPAFFERSFLATSNGLVLKPDGSVAWIASGFKVIRHDSTGTAVVDSGPGIDRHSLAAGGAWLYWTNAGSPRSAPFH